MVTTQEFLCVWSDRFNRHGMRVQTVPGAERHNDLFPAAALGDLDTLLAGLRREPDWIERTSASGASLLHTAAAHGRLRIVEHLIAAGASLNLPDAYGETPLRAALLGGHAAVAALLMRAGASILPASREN